MDDPGHADHPHADHPFAAPPPLPPVSVVVAEPAPKRKGGTLPWILAALATVAAVVFAVLWVSTKGDLDDANAAKASVAADLADAKSTADDLQSQLDTSQSDLDTANDAMGALQAQLDEVTADLKRVEAGGNNLEISDETALGLGRSFTDGADPALTDAEATCIGRAFIQELGISLLLELGANPEGVSVEKQIEAARAVSAAAETCDVELDRLGP